MPIRLIGTLIVAVLAAIFTGFNLDNKCDVWIFKTFGEVPVAFTIIISVLAGVVIMLPFTLGRRLTREEKVKLREVQREEKRAAKEERRNRNKKNARQPLPPVPAAPSEVVPAEAVPEPEAAPVPFLEDEPVVAGDEEKKDTKSE